MNVSADSDSSFFSLIKPNPQIHQERVSRTTKDEPKKDPDKKKLQKEQVRGKQKQRVKEGTGVKRISRRSLYGTQVELADILASCGVEIISVDMPPFMQIQAVDCARET